MPKLLRMENKFKLKDLVFRPSFGLLLLMFCKTCGPGCKAEQDGMSNRYLFAEQEEPLREPMLTRH